MELSHIYLAVLQNSRIPFEYTGIYEKNPTNSFIPKERNLTTQLTLVKAMERGRPPW